MTVIRGFALSLYLRTEYPARPFRTVRDKHATTKNNHTMADEKIIFSMVGVSKTFNNQKKVLNDIYLSFFYGAKIGIIGLNGSGKSTLMKIIAGIDSSRFLVEVHENEIAKIAGFTYPSEIKMGIKVGQEIKVADLWRALEISRERHDELAKMATQLRTAATRVDSINAALSNPIVEVKTA